MIILHHNINSDIGIMSHLNNILERQVTILNMTTHKQNTIEWHENRKLSIGCSELFPASGTKKQIQGIVERKLGISSNLNFIECIIWGSVFESSTKLVTEIVLGTKIYEVNGSIKHDNNINTCSPDGIGVIKLPKSLINKIVPKNINSYMSGKEKRFKKNKKYAIIPAITASYDDPIELDKIEYLPHGLNNVYGQDLIALFEFKSPHSRKIDHDDIKEDYLFQVLGGINILSFTTIGVFAEISFCEVDKFAKNFITLYDNYYDGKDYPFYFGACKYIKIINKQKLEEFKDINQMVYYDWNYLKGMTISQDYEVFDGPFLYNFGKKYYFSYEQSEFFGLELSDFGFPTNIAEFNEYYQKLNKHLDMQNYENRPHLFTFYEAQDFSIKYIPKVNGFINKFYSYCKDILDKVRS